MKYLETEFSLTIVPETKDDVDYLRKEYPHLKNYKSVRIAKPANFKLSHFKKENGHGKADT